MSGINFREDVQLQDWEELLAELSGDDVDDMVKGLEADTWEKIREFDFNDLPHIGNAYADTLLSRLEGELREKVGYGFLNVEKFINADDTSFSVNGRVISNMSDWKDCLVGLTGLDVLEAVIDDLMRDYDPIGSKTLTELHTEGRDAVIERYVPDEQAIKEASRLVGYEHLSPIIKWAFGAGFFIKAVVEEHIKPEFKEADVVVEDFDLLVTIQALMDCDDILSYDEIDDITNLTKIKHGEQL